MKQTKTKKYLMEYLLKFRFDTVVTIGIFSLIAMAQFLIPLVTQRIIDVVIPNHDMNQLLLQLMYLLGLTVLIGVLTYFSTILINKISQSTISQLRNDLYSHILELDYRYFEDHKTGDTLERINSDISVIQSLISPNTFSIFGSLITFIWIIGYMLIVDWKLMLILSVTFPILFFINRYFSIRVKQAYRVVRTTSSKINSHLQTTLTLIPLIKVSHTERYENRRFEKLTKLNNEANDKATQVQAAYGPTVSLVDTVGTMIVLGYGAFMVMLGSITIGSVVTYLSYLALLQKPMKSFSSMVNRFQQASVSLERIDEVFDTEPSIRDGYESIRINYIKSVEFKNVSFNYEPQLTVLDKLSFKVEQNRKFAIVGESGSGKTTITKLLTRLYDTEVGEILFNGINIKEIHRDSQLDQIGVVSQDGNVIDGTIYQNITYGCYNYHDEDVYRAMKLANIDDFVSGLPLGLDTEVGERGLKLSGGQKQRLAIARMFLKDAPLIILDEATASLDSYNESVIQASLETLMSKKTCIVIAHRLSTIVDADQILVLDKGHKIAMGNHETLLEHSPEYRAMFTAQFK